MRATILAAIAAAAIASPAYAQEKTRDFTGIRGDVIVGIDAVDDADVSNYAGLVYGGTIGYDRQFSKWVVGIEGEVTGSTADRTLFIGNTPVVRISGGRDFYGGVRAGYVVGNKLLFLKGGYTNFREEGAALSPTNQVLATAGVNVSGWRVGGGAEIPVGRFYLKGEYRYSNYEQNISKHQFVVGGGIRF